MLFVVCVAVAVAVAVAVVVGFVRCRLLLFVITAIVAWNDSNDLFVAVDLLQ